MTLILDLGGTETSCQHRWSCG